MSQIRESAAKAPLTIKYPTLFCPFGFGATLFPEQLLPYDIDPAGPINLHPDRHQSVWECFVQMRVYLAETASGWFGSARVSPELRSTGRTLSRSRPLLQNQMWTHPSCSTQPAGTAAVALVSTADQRLHQSQSVLPICP